MEIKVNEAEWNGLDNKDRETIEKIITSYFKGDTIKPDPGAGKAHDLINNSPPKNAEFLLRNPFCSAACGVTEAAAVAACSAVSGGVGVAICVAAAHAAGDYCRSRC